MGVLDSEIADTFFSGYPGRLIHWVTSVITSRFSGSKTWSKCATAVVNAAVESGSGTSRKETTRTVTDMWIFCVRTVISFTSHINRTSRSIHEAWRTCIWHRVNNRKLA
jgi:hypothetical protein